MWLVLALAGHIGSALVALSDKASVEKKIFNPMGLAFIAGASNLFFFLLFPWYLRAASYGVIGMAMLAGASNVAATFFYFSALEQDEASRVAPAIGSFVPLFTLILSIIVIGEVLTGATLLGFLLLISGGVMIEFHSVASFFSRCVVSLFSAEILSAVFFALYAVSLKYAFLGTEPFSAFLWSRVGFVAVALPFLFSRAVRSGFSGRHLVGTVRRNSFWFIGSRILSGVIPLILVGAIALGSPTLVNALQGVQYGFLFILAMLFSRRWPRIFGEKISFDILAQKIFAMLLIGAGLALVIV